jgi:hypothetical protein
LNDLAQLGMSVFGLAAMAMAFSGRARLLKWAPIVGLLGQPFWALFGWLTSAWSLVFLVPAFTAVYVFGIWKQWRQPE